MKFAKSYGLVIDSFPSEWQEHAISYKGLKKLVKDVVDELAQIGLNRSLLDRIVAQESLNAQPAENSVAAPHSIPDFVSVSIPVAIRPARNGLAGEGDPDSGVSYLAEYELRASHDSIVPYLRIRASQNDRERFTEVTGGPSEENGEAREESPSQDVEDLPPLLSSSRLLEQSGNTLHALHSLHHRPNLLEQRQSLGDAASDPELSTEGDYASSVSEDVLSHPPVTQDVTIPLSADMAFYHALMSAIRSLSDYEAVIAKQFDEEVSRLSDTVASVAHPGTFSTNELYTWRNIFQTWVESQIFEGTVEKSRGQHGSGESEMRLARYADQIVQKGFGDHRSMSKKSRKVFKEFVTLNVKLLDLQKYQELNSLAVRKILKKHQKRTALGSLQDLEKSLQIPVNQLILSPAVNPILYLNTGSSIAHKLLIRLTERLIPVIPSIDDYDCAVCMSIAYIPIRLGCRHLFCVRCLATMQRRGQAECPLCRSPTVLQANRENVDVVLKKFMKDWFPREARAKDEANQRERAAEVRQELEGIQRNASTGNECTIM